MANFNIDPLMNMMLANKYGHASMLRPGEEEGQPLDVTAPAQIGGAPQTPATQPTIGENVGGTSARGTKREFIRNLLGNFLSGLGEGMSAAAAAPKGHEGIAAMAGGIQAPEIRKARELEAQQRQAQIQAQQAMAQQREAQARAIPEQLLQKQEAMDKNFEAAMARIQGSLEKGDAASKPNMDRLEKTLASNEKLTGQRLTSQEKTAVARNQRIVRTKEGVWSVDPTNGEKIKIGDLAPGMAVGSMIQQLGENGEILGYFNPTSGREVGQPSTFAGARRTGLPVGEVEKRASLSELVEDADFLKDVAERHKDAIGVGAGRAAAFTQQNVPEFLHTLLPSEYTEPETIQMFRVAQNMRNQLLYALSGKQINEREYARLSRLVPEVTTPYGTFKARLGEYSQEINRILAGRKSGGTTPGRGSQPKQPKATGVLELVRDPATGRLVRKQ